MIRFGFLGRLFWQQYFRAVDIWLVQDDPLGCKNNMVEFIFVFISTFKISVFVFSNVYITIVKHSYNL